MSDRWHFYVIECMDGNYYAGIAKDVHARFQQHYRGDGSRYLRAHRPLVVRFTMTCPVWTKGDALRVEARFKKLKRAAKERFMQMEGRLFDEVVSYVKPHPILVTQREARR